MKSSEIKTKVNKYRNKLNYTQSKYQIHSMIPVVRYNNLDVALDLGFRSEIYRVIFKIILIQYTVYKVLVQSRLRS